MPVPRHPGIGEADIANHRHRGSRLQSPSQFTERWVHIVTVCAQDPVVLQPLGGGAPPDGSSCADCASTSSARMERQVYKLSPWPFQRDRHRHLGSPLGFAMRRRRHRAGFVFESASDEGHLGRCRCACATDAHETPSRRASGVRAVGRPTDGRPEVLLQGPRQAGRDDLLARRALGDARLERVRQEQRLRQGTGHPARRGEIAGIARAEQQEVSVVAGAMDSGDPPNWLSSATPRFGIPQPCAFMAPMTSSCTSVASFRFCDENGRTVS